MGYGRGVFFRARATFWLQSYCQPGLAITMRCLGPAILNYIQQHNLEDGKPVLVVREAVFPDAAEKAVVGDTWWVKEDFLEVTPHRFKGPQCVHAIVPGSVLGAVVPEHLKAWWHVLKKHRRPAKDLRRNESRAFLTILEISPMGFHCMGTMRNIDAPADKASAA